MSEQIIKNIVSRIVYPHSPELLKVWSHHVPDSIKYEEKNFKLEYELFESKTIFKISYSKLVSSEFSIDREFLNEQGSLIHDVINHILTTLRTFDHADLLFQRIESNGSTIIEIEIYSTNGVLENTFDYLPSYEPPIQFQNLFMQLEDHEGLEGFHFAFEDEQLFVIGLLIEANHSLLKNEYNVCILHCNTAIESCIFPILENYFRSLIFNKGNSNIKSLIKELPMNLKYEFMFGAVEKKIFVNKGELLERLKRNNKIRNSIIHSGYSAKRNEALECLSDSSEFIGMVYLQMTDLTV